MTKTVLIAEKFQNGAGLSGYVAEIGACMLGVQIGVAPEFNQSASYVEGWIAAMKGDNRTIFRAASEAQKAVDFILAQAGRSAAEQVA